MAREGRGGGRGGRREWIRSGGGGGREATTVAVRYGRALCPCPWSSPTEVVGVISIVLVEVVLAAAMEG